MPVELKYTITRDASEDFNKRVTNWIGDGIYIKFKSDYGNRYGYVTKMESRVYKDRHNKIAVSSVNGKGIFLFESKTNGLITCNTDFYGDFELIFTFLDNVEEITKDAVLPQMVRSIYCLNKVWGSYDTAVGNGMECKVSVAVLCEAEQAVALLFGCKGGV